MNKVLNKIIWLILAIPLAYLATAWNRLPETVAVHFDLRGEPNGFGSKNELLGLILGLTAVNIVVYLLLSNVHRLDPKKYAVENRPRLQRIGFAVTVFIAAILCMTIYLGEHPGTTFSSRLIFAGVGLLLCFIGNYLYNLKPNYFAGLRLPWTLENEENWKKTHLLAGKLFFGGGLLMAIVCLLAPLTLSIIFFVSVALLIGIIPCVYSYRLYRQQRNDLQDK